jgi:hypothetical protein
LFRTRDGHRIDETWPPNVGCKGSPAVASCRTVSAVRYSQCWPCPPHTAMLTKGYERTGFSHADVERFPGARFLLYGGPVKPNTSTPFCGDWGSRPNPSCGAVCCLGVYGDMAQSCWAWRLYGCSHARGRSEACASWGPNMSSGLPRAWDSVLTPSSLSSWVHRTNRVTIDSVG